MSFPFKVRSVYEYSSAHDDDLRFPIGQIITVTEEEGDDWYVGNYTDASGAKQQGLFPTNFVEKYEPEVPVRPARTTAARPKSEVPVPPPEEEKLPVPPVDIPATSTATPRQEEQPTTTTRLDDQQPLSPRISQQQTTPLASQKHDPAPVHTEPNPPPAAPSSSSASSKPSATSSTNKAAPPPPAPKSNAFRDRIAAFNNAQAAPITPQKKPAPSTYGIKKPFVAPPPSKDAYVPPVTRQPEPIQRPYIREEDPEIAARREEDRLAAERAGVSGERQDDAAEEEDVPKPMSLKERMAMLQREQEAQRSRQSDVQHVAKKKPPPPPREQVKKVSGSSADAGDELERVRSGEETERGSMDATRERPRVPSMPMVTREQDRASEGEPASVPSAAGEAGEETAAEHEDSDDDAGTIGPASEDEGRETQIAPPRAATHEAEEEKRDLAAEPEEDDDDEVDEEEQRKQRLRERMARLASGQPGQAMGFNPFGAPMPPAKKPTRDRDAAPSSPSSPPQQQQTPHQMVAIPGMGGMSRVQSPPSAAFSQEPESVEDEEDEEEAIPPPRRSTTEAPPSRRSTTERSVPPPPAPSNTERSAAPEPPSRRSTSDRPVPAPPASSRAAPPPLPPASTRPTAPVETRAVPPPPPPHTEPQLPLNSPGPGSESDDEMSMRAKHSSAELSGHETPHPLPIRTNVPPPPPQSPSATRRASYFAEPSSAISEKRMSRAVPPPIPGSASSPRPPPPPPPPAPAPAHGDGGVESDYEGDYDTDIASSAPHKEALKTGQHVREASLDDTTSSETAPASAPRSVPPPPPPPQTRQSMDTPRAPPPMPPRAPEGEGEDYDPYRYAGPARTVPPPVPAQAMALPLLAPPLPLEEAHDDSSADDTYAGRRAPQPPTSQPPPSQPPPRTSLDVPRAANANARRSMDQNRPSGLSQGQMMAQELELSSNTRTQWWTSPSPLPPALQARNGVDILSESEESSTSKRGGGRTTTTKDVYILYADYSQTHLLLSYSPSDPTDVMFEQTHSPPPQRLRQDVLEAYWQRFGRLIAEACARVAGSGSKKDAVVGDGTPSALPLELIRNTSSEVLLPVGMKAYGALVYANLANASTQQYDEIRPGDVVTARNARFEGHHGAMKVKYKSDYGTQGFVGVVQEWDGTRRSVRVWEQGREGAGKSGKGGVRSEKLRLGDLRSGEVKIWRVVSRDWVGWEGGK